MEQIVTLCQDRAVILKSEQAEVNERQKGRTTNGRVQQPLNDQKILSAVKKRRDVVVEMGPGCRQAAYIASPATVRIRERKPGIQSLIVTEGTERVGDISRELNSALRRINSQAEVIEIGTADAARREAVEISRQPDIVVATSDRVIDHLRRGQLDLSRLTLLIIDEPEDLTSGFYVDIEFICSKLTSRPQKLVFSQVLNNGLMPLGLLRRPVLLPRSSWCQLDIDAEREEDRVNEQHSDKSHVSDEYVGEQISDIIRRIHEDENPDDLNKYRRLFRKHVPFFTRGYFAAYLLKYGLTNKPRPAKTNHARNDFTSLFVGVGKNRRVFPRDLIQLLSGLDGITSDDIGEIKILDNYSFVEINPAKATTVIDTLNGRDFRGRRLSVNYARKKD